MPNFYVVALIYIDASLHIIIQYFYGVYMKDIVLRFIKGACAFLPAVFWGLLIYGFDAPYIANMTILSALLHEQGHELAFMLMGKGARAPRGTVGGFRISAANLSYKEELIAALGGPFANIIIGIAFVLFSPLGEYGESFGIISLLSAASNLLPTYGSDGYRGAMAFHSLISGKEDFLMLDIIGAVISIFIMLLSLYLMLAVGEGYWIYFLFLCNSLSVLEILRKRRSF